LLPQLADTPVSKVTDCRMGYLVKLLSLRWCLENLFGQAGAINAPFLRQYPFPKVRDDLFESLLPRPDRFAGQFICTQNGRPQFFEEMADKTLPTSNSTGYAQDNGFVLFGQFSPQLKCAMIVTLFDHGNILNA
jgi:hypothetical protein